MYSKLLFCESLSLIWYQSHLLEFNNFFFFSCCLPSLLSSPLVLSFSSLFSFFLFATVLVL
jgi:hypothetical protein